MKHLASTLFVTVCALATGCPTTSDQTSDGSSSGSGSSGGSATTTASTTMTTTTDGSDTGSASMSSTSATAGSSSVGDSSAGSETGDPECGPASVCNEPAPSGWFGPAVFARVTEGEDAPACPAEYPEAGPTVLEGYADPGPAICSCECDLSMAQSCSSYVYGHSTASCNTYNVYSATSENCTNVALTNYAQFYAYLQNNPFCMQNKSEEFPPVQWDASITSCKLPVTATACGDGGVCTPLPGGDFEAPVCIYKQGDEACPAGVYDTKVSFYTGVEDTRECTNCTCGTVQPNCNNLTLDLYNGTDCAGLPTNSLTANGACESAAAGSVAVPPAADDGCPVQTAPEPMGSIAPVGEFTFCCTG